MSEQLLTDTALDRPSQAGLNSMDEEAAALRLLGRGAYSDDNVRQLIARCAPLVWASARRRLGSDEDASVVTSSVFLVLARKAGRRWRRWPKGVTLTGWLFQTTANACRRLVRLRRSFFASLIPGWLRKLGRSGRAPRSTGLQRFLEVIDEQLDRLRPKYRHALLGRLEPMRSDLSLAVELRVSEGRARRWSERGARILARRLRKAGVACERPALENLRQLWVAGGCANAPGELVDGILSTLSAVAARTDVRPSASDSNRLARRLAGRIRFGQALARWRRRLRLAVVWVFVTLMTVGSVLFYVDSRTGHSRSIAKFFIWSMRQEARTVPGLAQPAKPWPGAEMSRAIESAAAVRGAGDFYRTTNIWSAHLDFSREQWAALQPAEVEPLPHFFQPDGTVLLRNPAAQRSGLAGVLGLDFHWTTGSFELGKVKFATVDVREKGNGTYLGSLSGNKRAFKVRLDRTVKDQRLGELREFNFNNLVNDFSFVSDTLAYEYFRDIGVPAPRTAFAYLDVSVAEQWNWKPLGLYVMVEPVDGAFAATRFGSSRVPIFKPVTYDLFANLGRDWSSYAPIYDLKTRATDAQRERMMAVAALVSEAADSEWTVRAAEWLDLDETAKFFAGQVLLANYDSLFSTGQNYYLYLTPGSNRVAFIPWDLDLAWGGFFLLGTTLERENASVWHPWVGRNRFLERLFALEGFRTRYRAELERQLSEHFVPARLGARLDELVRIVRGPVAAESSFRLDKFEQAVGLRPTVIPPGEERRGADRPAYSLKRFFERRAHSVRQQLDGKEPGSILVRQRAGE